MSFKERLRKTRIALGTGLLGLAAVAAPVKGQTHGAEPTNTNAVTATASDTQTQRKQKFEAAVRSGAPQTEIVKYIDFPEFIPVTKEGSFDEKKAEKWSVSLSPYLKLLAEKGKWVAAVDAEDAYKAFKETVNQKDVSLEDFEVVQTIAKEAERRRSLGGNSRSKAHNILMWFCLATALLEGVGVMTAKNKSVKKSSLASAMVMLALAGGNYYSKKEADLYPFADSAYRTYRVMYDKYIDITIERQQEQFKQTEKWSQVNKTLKNSRQ